MSLQFNICIRTVPSKTNFLFILSAKTLSQTYRRLRYVREYADYQRLQGEEILKKQEQVNQKEDGTSTGKESQSQFAERA